ncbi:O-acetyl-ADP-ribose deacetylase [Bowdeniella nasicola]|uniref:O-acetyl-ADP-ribose deacetylase n=1 Tax=Bowdeniella nasicola TaxID=208480 RepID=A0A1Q5Q2B4_9ACTO|nr:O-acetyl-ADP-ribose deacetylase [Bowdeniella nasicola]OKL53983.1 O-acetyl-ADP-ribose deacetylase [Bowdeniella nasicola]
MKITAVTGDLTQTDTDAVVNAANSSLMGGGGVDGALHAAAGNELLGACTEVRRTQYPDGLPVGEAVSTPGFDLPAQWVIHTVGPNKHRGETDPELLAACVHSSMQVARALRISSIAFPAISGGAYGWEMDEVAEVLVSAAKKEAENPDNNGIEEIRFVLFSPEMTEAFTAALEK